MASTATAAIIIFELPDFLSSAATESNVPKLALTSGCFSSRFGNSTGGAESVLIGSTLATAGTRAGAAAAAMAETAGLITTGAGAEATGLGAGKGASVWAPSSRLRR